MFSCYFVFVLVLLVVECLLGVLTLLLFDFSVPELGIKPRDSDMLNMLNLNTDLQPSALRFHLIPVSLETARGNVRDTAVWKSVRRFSKTLKVDLDKTWLYHSLWDLWQEAVFIA